MEEGKKNLKELNIPSIEFDDGISVLVNDELDTIYFYDSKGNYLGGANKCGVWGKDGKVEMMSYD